MLYDIRVFLWLVLIWDGSWTASRFVPSICYTSSQAVCHSSILALLGMVIGSQSTSNRWIGPRPRWLSGGAVCARVYSFVGGGVWLCVLTLYACCSLRTTAHLFHSISSLSFEFWVLSIIASTAVLCPWLVGCCVGRYSCEQVFLT